MSRPVHTGARRFSIIETSAQCPLLGMTVFLFFFILPFFYSLADLFRQPVKAITHRQRARVRREQHVNSPKNPINLNQEPIAQKSRTNAEQRGGEASVLGSSVPPIARKYYARWKHAFPRCRSTAKCRYPRERYVSRAAYISLRLNTRDNNNNIII